MEPETPEEKQKIARTAGVYMGMPATMLGCVFVGYLIGSWLDKLFHTGGILLAVFVFLGVGAGFYEVYQMLKKFN